MTRVNVETGRFRGRSLVLSVAAREGKLGCARTCRLVEVKVAPYTSASTPGRVEYAGRHGDTVYCEQTFPDEWLEFVEEKA